MKQDTQSTKYPRREAWHTTCQQPAGKTGRHAEMAGRSSVTTFDQSQGGEYPKLTNRQLGGSRFGSDASTPCLRPKDVLALLPVSKSTLWRWVRSGRLTAFKLGPRITVFSREEVMDVFFSEAAR